MTHICQSCGMLLQQPLDYGTNAQGMPIEDYCAYCYQQGQYTQEVTMDEMIRLCALYVETSQRTAAIARMQVQLPHLRRWAQREDTQQHYHKAVYLVIEYIQGHLAEPINLSRLASVASVSAYHLHRIFKATIGEPIAQYVLRLRMEHVAQQLKEGSASLALLAQQTGYSGEQALSRAFKKHSGIPPMAFRNTYAKQGEQLIFQPRICTIAAKDVICLHEEKTSPASWQRLYMAAIMQRLFSDKSESLELIIHGEFQPCIGLAQPATSNALLKARQLPEGRYAIFTHQGAPKEIPSLYHTVIQQWLPASPYQLGKGIPFVHYLNSPDEVPESQLLAELYLPLCTV